MLKPVNDTWWGTRREEPYMQRAVSYLHCHPSESKIVHLETKDGLRAQFREGK